MDRLDDQGRWQKPVFLSGLVLIPFVLGAGAFLMRPQTAANNTWIYFSAEGLNRAIAHTVTGMPGGRDIEIKVCNTPPGTVPVAELNGTRFEFEKSFAWEGTRCQTLRVLTPNQNGEVIASNIPGRLIALRKHRSSVGKDGSGKPLKWKILDARSERVLGEGELPIEGVKPLAQVPGVPRINVGGNWYYGRTMQLIDYWTMKPEIQSTFYTKDAVTQTIFVPSNSGIEALPFELGPDGKLLVADWGKTPACKPIPGQLIDYIFTNKESTSLKVINIQTIELPAFTFGHECD